MNGDHADPTGSAPLFRSPADVLRLVVAALALIALLVVKWWFGDALIGFASEFLQGFAAVPSWILNLVVAGTRVVSLVVIVGLVVRLVLVRQWRALGTATAAAAVAATLVALLDGVATVDVGDRVVPELDLGPLTAGWFPSAVGVAVAAAVLTAMAPWSGRRWRRIGWVAVLGLMTIRFLASPMSFDSVQAALIGWLAGSATLVLFGAPLRKPTAQAIAAGLAAVGLPLQQIVPASVDARGSTPYFAVGLDGGKLFVKALSTDERSADLLFRLYRWVQRRELGDERPFSSLRRSVEHEAFVALAARDLGIRTPRLRAVAAAEPGAFVLAYDAVDGRSLDRVPAADFTDDVLSEVWSQLGTLRRHRIAHRDLRLANLFLGADRTVWVIDFGFSEMAASDLLLANDVAEFVASSSLVVGSHRATAPAIATVDVPTRARAATRLRPWALSGATRTALAARPGLLDELAAQLQVGP